MSNSSISRPLKVVVVLVFVFATAFVLLNWRLLAHPTSLPNTAESVPAPASLETGGDTLAAVGASASESESVELPKAMWAASGIEVQPAEARPFSRHVRLTGKVALNEDHVAHIYPLVEGSVDSVHVHLGEEVDEGDLMVVIHSREIGQAKLSLYQSRLQHEMAAVKHRLQQEIAKNTAALISAVRNRQSISAIEEAFRSQPMGDYRERLLAAYSNYLKSQADVSRLESLVEPGAVAAKQFLTAEANRDADLATFQARIEQIEYEMQTSLLIASQSVKESETQVAVGETNLEILGYEKSALTDIDPAKQGESISHYPLLAPFRGTILTKDIVLKEHVRPDAQVLSIADLSTVWITADVYEEHVPYLEGLNGKHLVVRSEVWPDRTFDAEVFYTGDVMDEATRTISLRAAVKNDDHALKPGMFVSVEIPLVTQEDALTVPVAAIQEHEGEKFVFVQRGDDRFEKRDVQVGTASDQAVVITSGLQAHEPVAVHGGFILKSRLLADLMGEE